MRFTSIEIRNYRQYAHLNFDFKPRKEHDIHIIVATNGIGKTNLLNAINWCLYGEEPHLGDKSHSLPIINLSVKKDLLSRGEKEAVVSVKITAEDGDKRFEFIREVPVALENDYLREVRFRVTKTESNGQSTIYEDDNAKNIVGEYMPENIKQFFYFDGEQLDTYFKNSNNIKVKNIIHNISQVDRVSLIGKRLESLISEIQNTAGSSNSTELKLAQNEVLKYKKQVSDYEANIETCNAQISTARDVIEKCRKELEGRENVPVLQERLNSIRLRELPAAKQNFEDIKKKSYGFVQKYQILLSFYPAAKKTISYIDEKKSRNEFLPTVDKKLLETMILEHRCGVCNHELTLEEEESIKQMIQKIELSGATSSVLSSIESRLREVIGDAESYEIEKQDLLNEYKSRESKIEELETQYEEIRKELDDLGNSQEVLDLHARITENTNVVDTNNKKIGQYLTQLKDAKKKQEDNERKVQFLLSKEKEGKEILRQLNFTRKALDIVRLIEKEMMEDVREEMNSCTSEYYKKLLWKTKTYHGISFSDDYTLNLLHEDRDHNNNRYSVLGSCSAAERALVALSFTLALHKISGFNSLLFIDTPVKNISGEHRTNFAKVLKEVSRDKQLIMTFLQEEYKAIADVNTSSIEEIFDPIISTKKYLKTLDERKTTLGGV